MKATGIVRRIDDLGRVVIPKEIRRTMRIREGDPLEIYTDKDGGVIFKKYSLMGGLVDFAGQLCDTLNRTTGRVTVITDRDNCIAVTGAPHRELIDRQISSELERLMEGRQIYQYKAGEEAIPLCDGDNKFSLSTAAPILAEGDVLGCVIFVGQGDSLNGNEVDYKLAQSIAGFLGRHMEG
ncbi:MAG: stage V sporulation T C-terminal domain-containing protein [Lawsonibacter sp.]|nr:stage V sporulation T C-terminal domain-containing protein [Lawsonibacter sp.]